MEIVELPLRQLHEAEWNANVMDPGMREKLAASLERFGTVEPLVVRRLGRNRYEVLGGNQRLSILRERGERNVPCVVVDLDDAEARLLSQALNRLHGEDDLGRRAVLLRDILSVLTPEEVAAILPDTLGMLGDMATTASSGGPDMEEVLDLYERTRQVRLTRKSFVMSDSDWEIVEEAISRMLPMVEGSSVPNRRGVALMRICRQWLDLTSDVDSHSIAIESR
jgi:ParB family chromosome partitioning protein